MSEGDRMAHALIILFAYLDFRSQGVHFQRVFEEVSCRLSVVI